MGYQYTSPRIPYIQLRILTLAFFFVSAIVAYEAYDHVRWFVTLLIATFSLLFFLLTIRLRRVEVTSEGVVTRGLFCKRVLKYSEIKYAVQFYLFAPKLIMIVVKSHWPFSYYLYVASYIIGDIFNMNQHESVEYINTRAQAANSE